MNPVLEEIYNIIAAYALLLALVLVWVLLQFNKQKKLDQQLTLLEEEVAELKSKK